MTMEEAEEMLIEWVTVTRDRDNRVRWALAAGVSKYRVNQLIGIGRSTIDGILDRSGAPGPALAQQKAKMITDTRAGTSPVGRSAWSAAEARGFEPRMGANPNRISSLLLPVKGSPAL
jgi:hypothetical protein